MLQGEVQSEMPKQQQDNYTQHLEKKPAYPDTQ